jgi:hypothetical protein
MGRGRFGPAETDVLSRRSSNNTAAAQAFPGTT